MVGILDCEDIVAEPRDHEQLLVERVHIADATKVLDANAASTGLFIIVEFDVPVTFLVGAPRGALVELLHVRHHLSEILEAVPGEDQQQVVGSFPCMVALAFGRILAAVWNLKQAVVHKIACELLADGLLAAREALQKPGQDAEVPPQKDVNVL